MSNNIGSSSHKFLFFIAFLFILVAGLTPKDASLTKTITHSGEGLTGARYTIAETGDFLNEEIISQMNDQGFSMSLLVQLPKKPPNHFSVITSITDGSSDTQFLIGQWQDTLIVMIGDDYSGQNGNPALYIDTNLLESMVKKQPLDLVVQVTPNGSSASINGKEVASNRTFISSLHVMRPAQITFANASTRQHGWPGDTKTFKLFLSDSQVAIAAYDMRKKTIAVTSTHPEANIRLPPNYQISKPVYLSASSDYLKNGVGSAIDIIINIGGFVPFGYLLFYVLQQQSSKRNRSFLIFTLIFIAGAAVSLFIELTQGHIPSRHSTIFDVFFNVTGTMAGAFVGLANRRLRQADQG